MPLSSLYKAFVVVSCLPVLIGANPQDEGGVLGYYRFPAIYGDTIVFRSEGDLWRVNVNGGLAQRLTSHPRVETNPAISPDGKWLAFSATYEGPSEVYVMPLAGGLPERCTYEGGNATVVGWTKDGRVLYTTSKYSTLPSAQLCSVNPKTHSWSQVPLAQASDGCYADDGKTLFFTRFAFQGSQTKRYQGGTAQNLWRWDGGDAEAKPLTANFKGTSHSPMWWNGRVYFRTDRDGVMNIWSMDKDGRDLKQHTKHNDYDVQGPSLSDGRIAYQHGADIYVLDLKTNATSKVPIRLTSDLDQVRERWVSGMPWVTSFALSPDGSKIVLTARGQVFVAPVKQGRLIETTRNKNVRYRGAKFSADGKSLLALSDESGEVELWKLPILGSSEGSAEQLTKDSSIIRWDAIPSPDGKWIAHRDKNHRLFLYDTATKTNKMIAEAEVDDIPSAVWSPSGKHLAFVQPADNTFNQIKLYSVETGKTVDVTTDRFNSDNPAFTPDGRYLYFLSDRNLNTLVGSPWGARAPEPFYDKKDQVYYVALRKGLRSPWQADDELAPTAKPVEAAKEAQLPLDIEGLPSRIQQAPIPAGNYGSLAVTGDKLFFISNPTPGNGAPSLVAAAIKNQNVKVDTVLAGVGGFDLSQDGKKIMVKMGDNILVFDATGAPPNPAETRVPLDGWTFSFDPREEWLQMYNEAWRLHRDYLYAPDMQGVDWPAMKKKYRPLVDRVMDRSELSDVLAQMVGEVSVLHTFVSGGDNRTGGDSIAVGALGAAWERDNAAGGYRITRLYKSDPDQPGDTGPLLKPGVDVEQGDVIALIDGVSVLSVENGASLLRAKAGKQVRLKVYPGGNRANARDVIVTPFSSGQDSNLRYNDWEYSKRMAVEKMGSGNLGYVHLRAMGSGDMDRFTRDFYPVFKRQGLIVDVRHNNGGNIDSWVLEKLMRKAWMYWNQHTGAPSWNMQFAFRGPIVVLCDESTASDGEAFSEGFRRLGLGKVIGTRTWGGEVWLTSSNTLVDNGIATAAEFGVFGPEGNWLIEGEGVIPDIVVDNLPRATFKGEDAQLAAAVKYLQEQIAKNPNPVPKMPKYPDKSFPPKKGGGG